MAVASTSTRTPKRLPPLRRLMLAATCTLLAANAHAADLHDARVDAALANGLRPAVIDPGQPLPGWSLQQRMQEHAVPGVAIAVLREGRIVHSAGYGLRVAGSTQAVDAQTRFSVGSVSKVITAATTLRKVADGTLALDRDIGTYLHDWTLPAAEPAGSPPVTLRMLLSHTAGTNVHGFEDFEPTAALPTLRQILLGEAPARNAAIRQIHPAGTRMDYSGGGYMVVQQLLEDSSGQSLQALAQTEVFAPLGMQHSSFEPPLPGTDGNIAHAHDDAGQPTALPRGWESFPERAASGLWTTADDLARLVGALTASYHLAPAGAAAPFLPRAIATRMMTEVAPSWHGLGPRLDGAGSTRIFHHGGSNDSYRAWIEGYLESGDGLVILSNGSNGGALVAEIRNALSDALGRGVNTALRGVDVDPQAAGFADYVGVYARDTTLPMDLQRALADVFDIDALQVRLEGSHVRVGMAGSKRDGRMVPLSPNIFASPDIEGLQIEFHRDGAARVRALTVTMGQARAYYPRR